MKESEILTSHKICGGTERVTHVYTSVTDTVEVRMFQKNREELPIQAEMYYVIRYDGKCRLLFPARIWDTFHTKVPIEK